MPAVVTVCARLPFGWSFGRGTGRWSVPRNYCRPYLKRMVWLKAKAHRAERKIARTKCRQLVNGCREDFGFHVTKIRVTNRETD